MLLPTARRRSGTGGNGGQQLVYEYTADGDPVFFEAAQLPVADWAVVVTRTCEALLHCGQPRDALAIAVRAAAVDRLCVTESLARVWVWLTAMAHAALAQWREALDALRYLATHRGLPAAARLWNVYFDIAAASGTPDGNLRRVLVRLLQGKATCVVPLQLALGHHHMLSLHTSISAALYWLAAASRPRDPLVCLCAGAAFLRQISQRKTNVDRHRTAVYAFTFFQRYYRALGGREVGCLLFRRPTSFDNNNRRVKSPSVPRRATTWAAPSTSCG